MDYFLYRNAWRFAGPPHLEKQLLTDEYHSLLKQGGLLVRNTYHFDCQEETCFWNLIKDQFGGLGELSGNTRKKVRRSLEHFEFRLVDIDLIKREGFAILQATYDDYPISDRSMNVDVFNDYLLLYEKYDFDYWGVFDRQNGAFVGFCANHVWNDACSYVLLGVLPQYKRKNTSYPYYGLYYSMNRYYLQEKGLRYVTAGSRSISEHSNIQQFLIDKFHFRKSYCELRVYYSRWMKLTVKLLYPFRKIITLPRIKAILNMEAMQRGEK